MIIVEGPDGAGKTTLITQLKDYLGLPVAPRVVSQETEAMTDLEVWVELNLAKGFQPTIFDRHRLISEMIYGPHLRGRPDEPFDNLSQLYQWFERLYKIRPVIIYCLPPFSTVFHNVVNDPANQRVADHISGIYHQYVAKAASDWALDPSRTYIYNYLTDGQEAQPMLTFESVKRTIKREGF